jgi:hypothetical protein
MEDLLGREVDMHEVEDRLAARFAEVFEMEIENHPSLTVQRTFVC